MADVFKTFQKLKNTPLGEIAEHLGYLCMAWSWLEREVDSLLLVLLQPADEHVAASVIYNMAFRDKLKAVVASGFTKKPSDEWFAELKSLVDEIDNDLRPERNRMVHDSWHNTGEEAFRLTTYAKVSHEQARKLSIFFGEGKYVSRVDLTVLAIRTFAAGGHLDDLTARYEAQDKLQSSPETPA